MLVVLCPLMQTTFATNYSNKSKLNENIAKEILEDIEYPDTTETTQNKLNSNVTIPNVKSEKNENISEYVNKELKIIEFISTIFILLISKIFVL